MNEEVKLCTSSSIQQESTAEIPNTKEKIRLEQMKRKVKRVAIEWDDFVLQEQSKSLMYIDRSLCGDPMKVNFIDELNYKKCLRLRRKKTSKLFVGITLKSVLFILNVLIPTI